MEWNTRKWNGTDWYNSSGFREVGRTTNYKDNGIRWLLLSIIDALGKDTERLRVINHRSRANCESQRSSLTAYKVIIVFYSLGKERQRIRANSRATKKTSASTALSGSGWKWEWLLGVGMVPWSRKCQSPRFSWTLWVYFKKSHSLLESIRFLCVKTRQQSPASIPT